MNYTITVTNAQDASYTDAHVTDDLSGVLDDAVLDNNDARASSGSVTFTGPTDDAADHPGLHRLRRFCGRRGEPPGLRRRLCRFQGRRRGLPGFHRFQGTTLWTPRAPPFPPPPPPPGRCWTGKATSRQGPR